jgi:hypothetical protein
MKNQEKELCRCESTPHKRMSDCMEHLGVHPILIARARSMEKELAQFRQTAARVARGRPQAISQVEVSSYDKDVTWFGQVGR